MTMTETTKTKKNDFVEIEFVAKTKEGIVFDTTNLDEAKKAGLVTDEELKKPEIMTKFKPLKICIGQGQILKGFDKVLEDKETGKDYEIELKTKEAYGIRDSKLIKTVPLSAFEEMPQRGIIVNVNGMMAKVISVAGGRVLIDLNHPLSGKDIFYKFKILKVIEDDKEKVEAFFEDINLKPESIDIKTNEKSEKKAIVALKKIDENSKKFLKEKLKEMTGLSLEIIETKEKELQSLEAKATGKKTE
ncbi:MAG: FKBP-type peptidyl-prolyl cis-trans isomerase [Candidatus Pacearchaeota archaeon]|nr:FKBP-type peptidyl-prolyl cis-trans isomerase [Candidatus Pacearchaeota archaeon]